MTIEKIRLIKETLKALSEIEGFSYPMTLRETIKALTELEARKEGFYEKFYFAIRNIADYDEPLAKFIEDIEDQLAGED